ncbi:finTRIM family, member 64 isoform X2 [Ctenopharyngodon idella]|nr:finTRIM family, member 64 isoform X2 [Ctenopharyngodon idella]
MGATGRLQEVICRKHDKLLDIYCRTDQQCICYLCGINEHKNHDTVTAVEEKQEQLRKTQTEFKKRIQQKEREVQELRETVKSHKRSALASVVDSEKIFTELIHFIETRRSEFTQLIRDQEKAAVSQAEGILKRLEQEIDDLRRRDAELEQLSHTDNHSNFLQSFQSFSVSPEYTEEPITSSSPNFYDDVAKSASLLREKLEDFCKREIEMILGRVTFIQIIPTPEPKTRKEFLQYFCQLTLDPNTVNKRLHLSEENKMAVDIGTVQQYPDHPDRFDNYLQVLCKESVCGRCYWELEWSGRGVALSVSYKSISRKGKYDECVFGFNRQSWSLFYGLSTCSFYYDKKPTKLSVPTSCCRIGVYVDHSAGTLSFYRVSDTMTLIHRVQTTFTQPLYPGFLLSFGSTVKLRL